MRAFWRNYNLSIVLFGLFMTSWVLQGVAQWFELANEAQAHGQASTVAEWAAAFLSATFENWQSEFVQLLTFVVLTSFLIHKGSHESKDGDEEMKAVLGRIEERLKRLERGEAWPRLVNGRNAHGPGTNGNGEHARTGADYGGRGRDGETHGAHGYAATTSSGNRYATNGHERRADVAAYSAPIRP